MGGAKACSPVEDVVDLPADVGAQTQELSVDPVEDRFQEVSLSGILTVKQLQQLQAGRTGAHLAHLEQHLEQHLAR